MPKVFQPPEDTLKRSPGRMASRCREIDVSSTPISGCDGPSPTHFLDGFNVDACFDVTSIPDPPSPAPVRRRRLSTSSLTRSFGDVTNQKQNIAADLKKNNKRSRKSLCHIPSPVDGRAIKEKDVKEIPLHQRDEIDASRHDEVIPDRDLKQNLQLSIELDDSDGKIHSRKKRRKKRKSMEIPRDLVKDHAEAMAIEDKSKITLDEKSASTLPPSPKHVFKGSGMMNIRELQILVRGYCDLPFEERNSSNEAKGIQSSTGYPLIQPTMNEGNPLGRDSQREIFQRLSPMIDEMDRRKAKDKAFWERETQCRVTKTGSGKYRYFSLDGNSKVASKEYKSRYMATIERGSTHRLECARMWQSDCNTVESSSLNESEESLNGIGSDIASDGTAAQELDLDLPSILAVDESMEESQPKLVSPNEGDTMEICDTSMSLDMGDESFMSLPAASQTDEKKDINHDLVLVLGGSEKLRSERLMSPPMSLVQDVQDAQNDRELVKTVSEEELPEDESTFEEAETGEQNSDPCIVPQSREISEQEILPIPDREDSSSDPEIAQAERKLWDSIDEALKDYSQEVFYILQKKKQAKDAAQGTKQLN